MATDAYLRIDGIKGESNDEAHLGWIEVNSLQMGVLQPKSATASTAGGHTAERCEHRSITHRSGLEVDIRPMRKDGVEVPVLWTQRAYDQEATSKLIELFYTYAPVDFILFNDPDLPRVKAHKKHDDHFHVTLRG